jgi:hypothetical protein
MNEYGKLAREVAQRAPEALGDELPLNPLAAQESKADAAEQEDVLVSDTEEISDYSSMSQAQQQPVPMEDDKSSPAQEINILIKGKDDRLPKFKKGETILILKPAQHDAESPVWLATFDGFKKGKGNKCYVKYFQLVDWEFVPWEAGTHFEIHADDPVIGVVDKLPKGKNQVRAFFECVR